MYTIVYINFNFNINETEICTQICNTEHGLNEALKKLDYDDKKKKQICVFEGSLEKVPIDIKFIAVKKGEDNE